MRSIVIHGHFYQPPRDNPWLELVDAQVSAQPFHDWNQRIERECYRAVVAARVPTAEGRIARIVNTLASISFNIGPTLFEWLERNAAETYQAIIQADHQSRQRFGGHGNAIAMPYHHPILPLSSERDRVTEVRWGIADFRRRFGRDPEGMWLPETAADVPTLDVLAREGIRFTILAPHQLDLAAPRGMPVRVRTAGGRSIAVFAYNGELSHGVAFGALSRDAQAWVAAMAQGAEASGPPELVTIATDGETYGHHHRFADMALACALVDLPSRRGVQLDNFGWILAHHGPTTDAKLVEPSSWSCAHGVDRWQSDCGCRMSPDTRQAWRAPLRAALTTLAARCHERFEQEAPRYFADPWATRDAYGTVTADYASIRGFIEDHVGSPAMPDDLARAGELLELERNALRLFTSCAWFFDDIGGLEPVQVLRYAARALELLGNPTDVDDEFLGQLGMATSNDPGLGSGRDIFARDVRPRAPGSVVAAAGWALDLLVGAGGERSTAGVWTCVTEPDGVIAVTNRRTLRVDRWRAAAVWHEGLSMRASVSAPDGTASWDLGLDDLFEPHRLAIIGRVRARVILRALSPGELTQLADGTATLHALARDALVASLQALDLPLDRERLARVSALMHLVELERYPVPFDAQTCLYRLLERADPGTIRQLAPLARRFNLEVPE